MLNREHLHSYQKRGVQHVLNVPKCALFLQMGLGKSIITLTALEHLLYQEFEVRRVLIIAPLRVCNSVWREEAKKWEHTKHLKFSLVTGSLKDRVTALQRTADIYVINRENVKWLVEQYKQPRDWNFDMVVIDESSSFKSHASQRFKAIKKVLPYINRTVLLTGTPASNGYMDLWSQFYMLDGGYRLGRTITFFRNRYFDKDFMGFNYTLRDGAVKQIQDAIQDLVLSMQSEDYLELPEFLPLVVNSPLDGELLKTYKKFERDMLLKLSDEDMVTAVSAGVLTNKLLQFCSGNMYDEDGCIHHFHDLKVEMLKEILEDNPDENILVAYNYKHELTTLRKAFPESTELDKEGDAVRAWNKGEVKMLLAHPASAGHGLNLQDGGSTIVWYGFNWSLELYQQFNARLHRQGQSSVVRCFHLAVGEIETRLMQTLAQKEVTQDQLLKSLKIS